MQYQPTLSELRDSKNISQRELAEYLHLKQATMSQIELGDIGLEIERAGLIAQKLDVSLDEVSAAYLESKRRRAIQGKKRRYIRKPKNEARPDPPVLEPAA